MMYLYSQSNKKNNVCHVMLFFLSLLISLSEALTCDLSVRSVCLPDEAVMLSNIGDKHLTWGNFLNS